MSNATVRSGIDAYVASDHASVNYGSAKALIVKSGTPTNLAYLWFKNPAPLGATILSATLRIYGKGAWGAGTLTMTVQRVSATWKSAAINYTNRPAVTGAIATRAQANAVDYTEWAFDVAAIMQTITDGAPNYGLRLSSSSTSAHAFYSLESGLAPPTLDVTWSDAPDAPNTLSPSGGRIISIAKPVVGFNYVDVSGSTTMDAVQVQIDPAANWVTPAFDSGIVLTSVPELALTTTAYAGLALGAGTYWRVRVRDAAGLWSAWSDPSLFYRLAQGTLTVNNPGAPPNNFVTEWTPPITWALTGATQTAWRVTVALASNPTRLLVDTGRRTGTETAYTWPGGILVDPGATYWLTVETWDNYQRESTPGDPSSAFVARQFTYAFSAATAPVTGLTASQTIPDQPGVTLRWSRSTAPDSFGIWRDGINIKTGLLPGDLLVSGTSYEWIDRLASVNSAHTWIVQAIVNGVGSATHSPVTLLVRAESIWLIDPDGTLSVPILGTESGTFTMPDVGSVYEPVGAHGVVRIVQAQRGLEGSIVGRLTDYAGSTAREWETALLSFKRYPEMTLRLLIGNQSLRVVIGNVVLAPIPGQQLADRYVSFDFWSLDGVPL